MQNFPSPPKIKNSLKIQTLTKIKNTINLRRRGRKVGNTLLALILIIKILLLIIIMLALIAVAIAFDLAFVALALVLIVVFHILVVVAVALALVVIIATVVIANFLIFIPNNKIRNFNL